jgi:hypothetical protein
LTQDWVRDARTGPLSEASDATAPVQVGVGHADAARSKENILQWMSYLPTDCVNTMIEMGWDITT